MHCPVELDLSVAIFESVVERQQLPRYINWSKASEEVLSLFRQKMTERLSLINIPSHAVLHGDKWCMDESHKFIKKQYYDEIMSAITYAITYD